MSSFVKTKKKPFRPRRKKKITARTVDRKVNKILRQIEKKRTLLELQATTVSAGDVTWLSPVDLNTGSDDRIGESIIGKTMSISYQIEMNAASTHMNEVVRVMVLVYKQSIGAKPAPGSIINPVNITSYLSQATGHRFRILYDRAHVLNRLAELSTDSSTGVFSKRINLRDLHLTFNQTTVVESSGVGGEKNQLELLILTNASANGAIINLSSEFIYTDM